MQNITYETVLRGLNEAVASKGHDYVDIDAKIAAACRNVRQQDGVDIPSCIVGTVLVWLGVPVEWFGENDCKMTGVAPTLVYLKDQGLLAFESSAVGLLSKVQELQDGAVPWGEAVTRAHLGDEWFYSLAAPEVAA